MIKIAIINGPNLNLLGSREPEFYGQRPLDEINDALMKEFSKKASLMFFQSNTEGLLIDFIHSLKEINGIVINPGALTHTSIALRDALLSSRLPAIEVHLSNVYKRESFRHNSYFSDICLGTITGLGAIGYNFAIQALLDSIKSVP